MAISTSPVKTDGFPYRKLLALLTVGLIWIIAGLWIVSEQKLDEYVERGNLQRAKRDRPVTQVRAVIILGWGDRIGDSTAFRDAVLQEATKLSKEDMEVFELYLDEPENKKVVHSALNLMPLMPPVSAYVTAAFKNTEGDDDQALITRGERLAARLGLSQKLKTVAVYVVTRSVYTEFGEYDGMATIGWDTKRKRDWPPGTKTPYVAAITTFPKPSRYSNLSTKEWALTKWWDKQSPMSEQTQPRPRYVRNYAIASSPGAPEFAGFVVELFPTKKHMDNMFLFFAANTVWELVVNIAVMLRSAARFSDLHVLQGTILSEYIFL